jgi:hypothetical protein
MPPPVLFRAKPTCRIDSVRFSPDGRHVAWIECDARYELVCCEVATGRELFRRRVGYHWNALAWAGPSTLVAWAEKRGSRDNDDDPWAAELYSVPSGAITARHTLPAAVNRRDAPHFHGAHGSPRALVATTRSHHRAGSSAITPAQAWVVDATTGAAVKHLDVASAIGVEADSPLSLWALSPDGERVAVSSFVGADRDDDVLHCFAPEGLSQMAKGRLHQPEWIDARTVLTRGQVAREQTMSLSCVGEASPRVHSRSETLFAFGALGAELALFDAMSSSFVMRSLHGEERVIGRRANVDLEHASPRWTFLAANHGGATRVLVGAAEKLPAANREGVPGAEGDETPPTRAITLSDAVTGDRVVVHGVDALHDRDPHGLFNPVEFTVDPSGRSLAVLVRRATSKKRYAPQHNHLVVCDLAAVFDSLEPRKAAGRRAAK